MSVDRAALIATLPLNDGSRGGVFPAFLTADALRSRAIAAFWQPGILGSLFDFGLGFLPAVDWEELIRGLREAIHLSMAKAFLKLASNAMREGKSQEIVDEYIKQANVQLWYHWAFAEWGGDQDHQNRYIRWWNELKSVLQGEFHPDYTGFLAKVRDSLNEAVSRIMSQMEKGARDDPQTLLGPLTEFEALVELLEELAFIKRGFMDIEIRSDVRNLIRLAVSKVRNQIAAAKSEAEERLQDAITQGVAAVLRIPLEAELDRINNLERTLDDMRLGFE